MKNLEKILIIGGGAVGVSAGTLLISSAVKTSDKSESTKPENHGSKKPASSSDNTSQNNSIIKNGLDNAIDIGHKLPTYGLESKFDSQDIEEYADIFWMKQEEAFLKELGISTNTTFSYINRDSLEDTLTITTRLHDEKDYIKNWNAFIEKLTGEKNYVSDKFDKFSQNKKPVYLRIYLRGDNKIQVGFFDNNNLDDKGNFNDAISISVTNNKDYKVIRENIKKYIFTAFAKNRYGDIKSFKKVIQKLELKELLTGGEKNKQFYKEVIKKIMPASKWVYSVYDLDMKITKLTVATDKTGERYTIYRDWEIIDAKGITNEDINNLLLKDNEYNNLKNTMKNYFTQNENK
ncbi:hypothetical protein DRN73_10160 [Candidatus Pacearchaeota archaeon]|nr:MAG: hypothetical protein DRN73_10160 [Candidatus Pacearchaeota archaeon]